jgi:glycosyltransferase involved in cell wall biosynthesis
MRLAVDVTALHSARTGVGVFTSELLERLHGREDIDLVAYAVTWRGRGRLRALVPPGTGTGRGPMAARPLRAVWKRTGRPPIEWWTGPVDVVHGPNFVVPPARDAALLVTVHDLTPLRFPELANRDTRQYPALLRAALGWGAHVHTVSEFVADEVVEAFSVPRERVHVVPNGIAAVDDGDSMSGRLLAGGERYVLALGTVEPRKDLPSLVAAFDAVAAEDADVRLVVAGQDGWGVEAYESAVASASHAGRIVRLGYVTDEQRADLLAGASVFAYPSRYEGFGLPPLEAMAVGVPVVTTHAGALPEIVGDAALTVEPGDGDALGGALSRVLSDEDERARLRAAGLARIQHYDWATSVARLVDVYGLLRVERKS